jgi:hypothetical protein
MSEQIRQSFESVSQVDWRNFPITRIKPFAGRTVGSLTPEEFAPLCQNAWLAKAREQWDHLDVECRAHYYAITARITYEKALQDGRKPSLATKALVPTAGLLSAESCASEAQQAHHTEVPPAECSKPAALPPSPDQCDEKVSSAEQSGQMRELSQSEEALVEAERSRKATEMVLRWIERARDDLRNARTYSDFKAIKDTAQLASDFAAVMVASAQARNEAEEMRLRAERGMSLMFKDPLAQRHESGPAF